MKTALRRKSFCGRRIVNGLLLPVQAAAWMIIMWYLLGLMPTILRGLLEGDLRWSEGFSHLTFLAILLFAGGVFGFYLAQASYRLIAMALGRQTPTLMQNLKVDKRTFAQIKYFFI